MDKKISARNFRLKRLKAIVTRDSNNPQCDQLNYRRPRSRAECIRGIRPCPFVGCRYHIFSDKNGRDGSFDIDFSLKDLLTRPHTCSLDAAREGVRTQEEVAELMRRTRGRINQIEQQAKRNFAIAYEKLFRKPR